MTGSGEAEGRSRRALMLVGGVVLGAVVIGGVLFAIDRTPESTAREVARDPSAIDLIPPPPPLDGDDPAETGRGWIQIADDDGRLAQQYRCDFLDPSPEGSDPGWIRMTRPQLEVFQDDGSVIVLTGEEAMAFAPSSAVESGMISGDVVIRVYGAGATRRKDRPLEGLELELRTDRARLDSVLGEVTCPGSVLAEAPDGVFVGRDVRLLLGGGEHAISSLSVREVDHVRLVSAPATSDRTPADAAAHAGVRATVPHAPRPVHAPAVTRPGGRVHPVALQSTSTPAPRWYRMVMREEVRIHRGMGETGIEASADELHVVFGEEREGAGLPAPSAAARADAIDLAPATGADHTAAWPGGLPGVRAALTAGIVGRVQSHPYEATQRPAPSGADLRTLDRADQLQIAPAPSPDDTWVTCTGGLVMRPLDDPADRPAVLGGSRLELRALPDAPPVTLTDRGAGTTALARRASYELPAGRIALDGDAAAPVDITGPEFSLTAPSISIVRADGVGRLDGAGRLAFRGAADEPDAGERRLDVRWSDGVDLAFDRPAADADPDDLPALDLTALREAAFAGSVRLAGGEGGADLTLLPGGEPATPGLDEGTLTAEEVIVAFAPDGGGDLQPTRLRGNGDVVVTSGPRRLWADAVDAAFAMADDDAASDENDLSSIERVIATGAVAVRLEEDRFAWADRIELEGDTRRTVLEGREVRLVAGADRLDRATRVEIRDADDRAQVTGPGRFRRMTSVAAAAAPDDRRPAPPEDADDLPTSFDIRWTRSLAIDPQPEGGRRIEVTGAVDAVAETLALRGADRVLAFLAPEADAGADADPGTGDEPTEALRRIEAEGALTAIALEDDAALDCRRLAVDLRPGPDGPEPARLEAGGDVRVTSPDRRLWSDSLIVTFLPGRPAGDSTPSDAGIDAGTVETVLAEGGVEVRLADGRRVLGRRLEASGLDESAVITGDLLVATSGAILDQATRIEIDDAGDTARVVGPGRFLGLAADTPLPDAAGRSDAAAIRRLVAGAARELEATWEQDATWTAADAADVTAPAAADGGAGTLVLRGAVDATAEPRPRERNRIRGGELTLVFAEADAAVDVAADANANADLALTDRRLARMIARTDAQLESRAWLREDRADLPRVLALNGDEIDWDQRAGIAIVDGPGRLLVRDVREPEATPEAGAGDADAGDPMPGVGFGARGTSQFKWTGGLRLEPDGDASRVTMTRGVEVIHRAPDGRSSTLTSERLEAVLGRIAAEEPTEDASTMALGGPVELQQITADGSVYVATPARDVTCELFVYDVRAGLARIASRPGRPPVSILEEGAASSFQISGEATWNLRTDRIVVAGGAGSADGR